jgi:purine-binding chemotaxis protein CheW
MDLAKIRQKARQEQNDPFRPAHSPQPQAEKASAAQRPEEVSDVAPPRPAAMADDFFAETTMPHPVASNLPHQPPRRHAPIDPLGLIMAGRAAAGCDEDMLLSAAEQSGTADDDYEEYLCIRVSDEIYGINIMRIKEIIKPREVTEVPRAPSFVSGVISLRGVIIPVLDLLDRLGLVRESVTGRERVVVVKNDDAYTGLLVDEVIQVVRIAKTSFEPAPAVLEGIDRDFVTGIGRADSRMIILLNLETIADINLL